MHSEGRADPKVKEKKATFGDVWNDLPCSWKFVILSFWIYWIGRKAAAHEIRAQKRKWRL
jgi:hypothetical protein